MAPRSLLIDGLKVVASQLIVLHHIVRYEPMADVLVWPPARAFLIDEARVVVQIFLVIGGFLAARGLSRRTDSLPTSLLLATGAWCRCSPWRCWRPARCCRRCAGRTG
jgi:peptidoglycan/LPS O-acetylase OafA/YrhL